MGWIQKSFLLLLFTLFVHAPLASAQSCRDLVSSLSQSAASVPHKRTLEEIQSLRIMTFNVLNLFQTSEKVRREALGDSRAYVPRRKPRKAVEGIAHAISEKEPDVVILQEVEDLKALEDPSAEFLGGQYQPLLQPGNDPRGINIGFLIKKDLPFLIEQERHKEITWKDPVDDKVKPLFSRDLPVLLFRTEENADPFLILLGHHAKSQRDQERPTDPLSKKWRTAQHEAAMGIVADYQKRFGQDAKIVFAGDFNTNVTDAEELSALKPFFKDSFTVAERTTPPEERITHTFHPRDGPTVYSQLDSIMVSPSLADKVSRALIHRYRSQNGSPKRLPKSLRERFTNPSDHYPVVVDIKTVGMF